jgi:hypothetical protein
VIIINEVIFDSWKASAVVTPTPLFVRMFRRGYRVTASGNNHRYST